MQKKKESVPFDSPQKTDTGVSELNAQQSNSEVPSTSGNNEGMTGGKYDLSHLYEAPTENKLPTKSLIQPEHKVVADEHLANSTKANFVNNPLFQDTNPNAEANKRVYVSHLAKNDAEKLQLEKSFDDVKSNRTLLNEATKRLSQNSGDVTAIYDSGTALLGLGKPDDAITAFKATLNHLSQNKEQIDNAQGIPVQNELAMNTPMTKSGATNPSNSLFGIGAALSDKGDYKGSIEAYTQAFKADPSNPNIQKGLAYSQLKLGDKEQSEKHLGYAKQLEESNKPFEAMRTQIGEEAKGDIAQQKQADEMKSIADNMESFVVGREVNGKDAGTLGFLNPLGKMISGVQGGALTMGEGMKQISESKGSQSDIYSNIGSGLLTIAEGGVETAFGAMAPVTGFNAGISLAKDAISKLPESAAKVGNEAVSSLEGLFFGPVTVFSSALGYDPNKGSDAEKLLHFTDIVGSMVIMGGAHKLASGVKVGNSIKDLQEITKKAAENGDVKALEEVKNITDKAKTYTLDNIRLALEKEGSKRSKEIVADIDAKKESDKRDEEIKQNQIERQKKYAELMAEIETHANQLWDERNAKLATERDNTLKQIQDKRNALGNEESVFGDIPKNVINTIERIHDSKPTDPTALSETKDYLFNEYKRLEGLKKDNGRMFTVEQINDAQAELDAAAKDIDKHSEMQNEMSPELVDLHNKADELQKAQGLTPESQNDIQKILADVKNQINAHSVNAVADKTEQALAKTEVHDIDKSIESEQEALKVNANLPNSLNQLNMSLLAVLW